MCLKQKQTLEKKEIRSDMIFDFPENLKQAQLEECSEF